MLSSRRPASGTILPSLLIVFWVLLAPNARAQAPGNTFINPPGLTKPTGYTHVVVAADRRTVYIAGQVAFDSTGKLVGGEDFQAQAEQVFANLRRALASVGASFADLVKTTTFVTDAKQVPALREIRARYLDPKYPPANTLVVVSALARPGLLIEIEAVAVLRAPFEGGRGGQAVGRSGGQAQIEMIRDGQF